MSDATQFSVGKILKDSEGCRDAIHVAVLPVVAGVDIRRSARIKVAHGTTDVALPAHGPEYGDPGIGIADPFLDCVVRKGQRFWMFLLPNTITGLRHDWTHPALDDVRVPGSEAETWLRSFAEKWNFDYDELIAEASSIPQADHFITARGVDLHDAEELGPDHDLFWQHLEALTGERYGERHRKVFGWGCSC